MISHVWQFLSGFMQHSRCFLVKCTVKMKDENRLNLCLSIAYVYVLASTCTLQYVPLSV